MHCKYLKEYNRYLIGISALLSRHYSLVLRYLPTESVGEMSVISILSLALIDELWLFF